ncbi:MAG: hypothetical protein KAT65_21605 [Methanophagales archaeon]|nr:hypothetical protein [Methanophagales archaeon]
MWIILKQCMMLREIKKDFEFIKTFIVGIFSVSELFLWLSIQQMARYMAERGIPFFRQSIEESKRDVREAEGWLKDAHTR